MRKQTKLVAVLSAAALLALGASMTSFAAGWEKDEAGIWHFYDEDDELVTGEWKKDGGKWFYLDDDGDMLTDAWVDDEYYVGDDGAMLVNQWIKTYADEDIEDPEDDGEHWYYFNSKGKKVYSEMKKINGKYYFFNEDGKMRDGWYTNGTDVYYLGDEDDGARASGWLWLELPDDEDDAEKDWHPNCSVKCDDEGWYYFGNDGKMYKTANKKKKINGKYYYFNEDGQMLYEWINVKDDYQLDGVATEGSATASPSVMEYANQVEEGWRADGWYEIDGSSDTKTQNDTDWYYFKKGVAQKATTIVGQDKDGEDVYRARIKVEGKYFCFNEFGQMQTGLQRIADNAYYYFDENGYMKTGKVASVEEDDDETYAYYFSTKNGNNGKGVTGVKDGYLYWNGKRLDADDDYRLYVVNGDVYLVNTKGKIQKSTSKKYAIEDLPEADYKLEVSNKGVVSKVKKLNDKGNVVETLELKDITDAITAPKITLYDVEDNGADWAPATATEE